MTDIRKIRLDTQGILTQDSKGKMKRTSLSEEERELFKNSSKINSILKKYNLFGLEDVPVKISEEITNGLSKPLRIYYGIEPRCELNCTHCGPRDFHEGNTPSTKENENYLINHIAESGAFQLQLTGGEIGVRGKDLLNTLDITKDLDLAVILSTNGVWRCINEKDEFIKNLASYNNIIQTKISIEGKKEFHDIVRKDKAGNGTYDESVRTLKSLTKHGIPVRINATIFKSSCNKKNLDHLVGLAQKYGANLQPIPLRCTGRASNMYEEVPTKEGLREYTKYATKLRKETGVPISFNFDIFDSKAQVPLYDTQRSSACPAGLIGAHITHTGEVYPCGFSIEIENGRFRAGKISEKTSLVDIWQNSDVFNEIRNAGKSEYCNSCGDYNKGCWGGCWVEGYLATGRVNGLDPHCPKDFV